MSRWVDEDAFIVFFTNSSSPNISEILLTYHILLLTFLKRQDFELAVAD